MKKINLSKFNPCKDGLDYYNQFSTFNDAWISCPRGDWMLWIAYNLEVNKRKLTLAKALCAKTVIDLMEDQRSIDAVKAAIDYGNGLLDDSELKQSADAAYAAAADAAAAYVAAYAADTDTARAAAYAAYAAVYAVADVDAAYAANAAADAAAYAADTAAAYADAVKIGSQKQTANICRDVLTEEVFAKVKEAANED